MKNYLLFDLDGTLTDPKVGICTCVQYALASFGIEEPDLDKLEPFIGPPLKESFMEFYNMSEEQAQAAVAKYRERFSDVGLFENEMYAGIPKLLQNLCSKGMYLAVASSKPTVFVERILEHFGIRKYFKVVVGSELDGRRVDKAEVVAEALKQLFDGGEVDKSQVYMIGDRKFDVEGARALGIESVGVTYGYGDMEELRAAKADYIVRSVDELQRFLLRGTEEKKKVTPFQKIWTFVFPFLMFLLIRQLASYLMLTVYAALGGKFLGMELLTYDGEGMVNGITGNGSAIMQAVGFLFASIPVFRMAKVMITKTAEERSLLHIKREPGSSYGFLAMALVGTVLGLNLLFSLIRLLDTSVAYQEVVRQQYAASFWLGLLVSGLVAPIAEELMFRGIIYNCLYKMMKPSMAMLIAALLFSVYHGNSVQGIYGFLMSCLFIYAYEFFGDFKVPVAMHVGANLLAYCLSYLSVAFPGIICWPACTVMLLIGAAGIGLLLHRKKVF